MSVVSQGVGKVGRNGPEMGTRHLFSPDLRGGSKVAWKTGTCPHFASNGTLSKPDFAGALVVSDTGPLIALAKVDCLGLLRDLFKKVLIPPAVHRELYAKSGEERERLEEAFSNFVIVVEFPAGDVFEKNLSGLGTGEQQAILLARWLEAPLLIDERQGRTRARHAGLKVTGTVAVLSRASREGRIVDLRSTLREMRDHGYWITDGLIEAAVRLASTATPAR